MICQLSARSANSVADLVGLDPATVTTLAEEIIEQEERTSWGTIHEVLAHVHDLLSVMRVEALALGGVKRHNLPKPERLPRPGDDKANEVRVVSPGEAVRLMMAS
jgi:hypothetical protein